MTKIIRPNGFTLIELLIVIVIIGILAALIATNLYGGRQRATDNQKKTNLGQLKIALHSYYATYHIYPAGPNGIALNACGVGGTSTCTSGASFTADGTEYLSKLPSDFRYYQCNDGDDFRLKSTLINVSDADIPDSQTRCPASTCTRPDGLLIFGASDYVVCGQ
jgi:general secretion pathway protein G